jgi:hypothetical protein
MAWLYLSCINPGALLLLPRQLRISLLLLLLLLLRAPTPTRPPLKKKIVPIYIYKYIVGVVEMDLGWFVL